MNKKIIFQFAKYFILIITAWLILSFNLLQVPPGLNNDEAEIGYNSALITDTLKDANNRFLPIFVLSSEGIDWHQPITVYTTAIAFKLFGISFFTLRAVSIFFAILASIIIYYLTTKLFGSYYALFSFALFLSTPIIFIQSHLALENISLIPILSFWLLNLWIYYQKKSPKNLILAGISLGLSLYAYKGMRLVFPAWIIISFIMIYLQKHSSITKFKHLLFYILPIVPFLLIMPLLEFKYGGAIIDRGIMNIHSYQDFLLPYLSSFDPSFLFIQGDQTPYHSTGLHGMFLLATLPLFLIGAYQSIRNRGFLLFLLLLFATTPIFFGFTNTFHRASRLIPMVIPYTLLATYGLIIINNIKIPIQNIFSISVKKLLNITIILIIGLNALDFSQYYLFTYPYTSKTREAFSNRFFEAYQALATESQKRNLKPTIEKNLFKSHQIAGKFFNYSLFKKNISTIENQNSIPNQAIVLSDVLYLPNMTKLNLNLAEYNIFVPLDHN